MFIDRFPLNVSELTMRALAGSCKGWALLFSLHLCGKRIL
jgi:hypothetical protein